MIFKTSSKIIAAVLTAALALSPVFVTPISADDGQDVEESASSWRYQDGDIIVDESLDPMESDSLQLLEDYHSQMGSSAREEEPAEQTEELNTEAIEEPTAEPSEPAEELTGREGEMTAQSEIPEAKAEEPAEVIAPEPELAAKSETVRDTYWTWSSGKYRRGPGYLKGIDVSYWQGSINWAKVKKAGVDFAIIRCGYGSNSSSYDDSKFAANVKGCVENGIPYGVYLYGHANTVAKAKDEADHALRQLKANNCEPAYPVYYDLEDKRVANAGKSTICKMANAFCEKLEDQGYGAGVYANLNWWNNKLTGVTKYDRWVAQWNTSCSYTKDYSIWQCTSSAGVSGIKGRVDANLLMVPKANIDNYMSLARNKYRIEVIDGVEYCVDREGNIVTNIFAKIDSYIYGFGEDGAKLYDGEYQIGYKTYTLDSQGRAYIFKAKTTKEAAYYAKAGSKKKGTLEKGTSFYVLRTSGKWSKMADGYWVKTSLTKKTAVYPTITPSKTVEYKAKLKKKTRSYSGPSKNYIKKKNFAKNKTVTVIGTYGNWSKVSTGQWLPSKRLKKK